MTGQETTGTNRNTGGSVWTSANTLPLRMWLSTACPGQLRSLHPWRYSNAIWTWSWATGSRWLCLSRQAGPDDLQRSLPISTTWWVCCSILATKIYPTVFEIINLHSSSSLDTPHLKQANRKQKKNLKAFLNCLPHIQIRSSYKRMHSNYHFYLGLNKQTPVSTAFVLQHKRPWASFCSSDRQIQT